MKPNLSKIIINTIVTTMLIALTACGGGGASDSSSSSSSSTSSSGGSTYTGSTSQATISADNADDFALPILEGGISSSGIYPLDTATSASSSKKEQRDAMMSILADQAKNQVLNAISTKDTITPSASTSLDGSCGGTYVFADNSSYTSSSGILDFTFTYTNYCNGSVTQDGSMSITGNFIKDVNTNGVIFQTLTMTITDMTLTVTTNSGSATSSFSGAMTLTFDGTTANDVVRMEMDMVFVGENGLTFKVENYVIDRTNNMLTIDGRFYHPINGYVDVTTTEPFDLIPGSSPEQYCSGSMQVSGSGGVVDFTADATCSNYEVCYTPTGGSQTCNTRAWP